MHGSVYDSIAKSLDDLTKFIDPEQIPVQYNGKVRRLPRKRTSPIRAFNGLSKHNESFIDLLYVFAP